MNNKLLENYILEILQEEGEYPASATRFERAVKKKSKPKISRS